MNQNQFEARIGELTEWCRNRKGFSYESLKQRAVKIFGCSEVDRYFSSMRDYYRAKGSHHADRFDRYQSLAAWFEMKAWNDK